MTKNIITPQTSPSEPKHSGLGGLNLSSGMEAAVTAALSELIEILAKINNQELEQTRQMAKAIKLASKYSAESTRESGSQMFAEALAQGIGGIVGSGISLGSIGYASLRDPHTLELNKLQKEEQGIHNYKASVPKEFRPSIDERVSTEERISEEVSDEGSTVIRVVDHREAVTKRLEGLRDQKSFVNEEGRALKPSEYKHLEGTQSDEELMNLMDQNQATELHQILDKKLEEHGKRRQEVLGNQLNRQNMFVSIGKSIGDISNASGMAVGGFAKKEQKEDEAEANLSSSAVQGMQGIYSQESKTANDALSQAQQTIQTFATISNGNRFQG